MKIKHSILIGLFVLLLFSCEKPDPNACHNAVIYYNYLTDGARKQTPYFTNPSFDTISFASDKGDTVTFVKTKTDSTWYKEEINGNPACDWDKNYYQVLHNSYATIKGNGSFDVKHYLKKNSYYSNYIEINFNSFHFNFYDDWIGLTRYPTYKEIISIKNIDYYSSIQICSVNADTTQNYTLINKSYGLFFINDKVNNTYFVLIK
jgi:hypothetical protein